MKLRYEDREQSAALYGIFEEDRVLDAGCGPGDHKQYGKVSTHFQRADVLTDAAPRLVEVYKDYHLPFYLASVEALPFEDKEFDFVWCSHVLEHVEDPEKACQELVRVGRRGRIRCPAANRELFYPNQGHIWLVRLESNTLIFHRKPPLFESTEWKVIIQRFEFREVFKREHWGHVPYRFKETLFDWFDDFDVEVHENWNDRTEAEMKRKRRSVSSKTK